MGHPLRHVAKARTFLVCLALTLGLPIPIASALAEPVDADVLLRGGTICDGSGAEPVVGDVAIRGGRIVALGRVSAGKIGRVIDCRGMIVAPGLIDVHTHTDGTLAAPGVRPCLNYLLQGCTTLVTGNCGGSRDINKFLQDIDAQGAGTNIAHLVGHGTVRQAVLRSERRAPSAEELERMKTLVAQAMRDGAWGMSSGLIYAPSSYAQTDELTALARVAAAHGGIYATHIRGEADELLDAVSEAIRIGRESGAAVHVSHFKAMQIPNWGRIRAAAAMIDQARAQGLKITADQYPYTANSYSLADAVLPEAQLQWCPRSQIGKRMAGDAAFAALVRRVIVDQLGRFEKITIAASSKFPQYVGKNLKDIAAQEKMDAVDLVLKITAKENPQVVSHSMSEADVRWAMTLPWVATASDGAARRQNPREHHHPRNFGTFARKIGRYALQDKVLPLAQAIRSATGLPADIFGFAERGYLRPGYHADVMVFDPTTYIDRATFDKPQEYATGVRYVFLAGQAAVNEGKPSEKLFGRALRHPSAQASQPLSLEQLRQVRKQLAHRPRRIIFNNDGCDCLYYPKDKPLTAKDFLAMRTAALVGSQVDAIAYCSISSGFSFFTHGTKAGTVLTRQSGDYGISPTMRNVAQELIDQGADCLKLNVDFAHQHGMESFWSMRMNDTHDAAYTPAKPYLLYPPLKVEHPEWLVGEPIKRSPHGRWSSVDYARPEIRDLAFRYLEEVCRNYDVDGIELDFFRHLCYFKSTAFGGAATQAERDMMTDLMRRVRRMTEARGMARGRPILVAIRVPDSLEFCRDLGFDLQRWLEDGLLDMLITTCYFRLNPWKYSVELGHRYGVSVYPCLSDSRTRGETRFHRNSPESNRGRAADAWLAGADGIHVFNLFDPRSPVWREVGDRQKLRTMSKIYFVADRDGRPGSWLKGGEKYQNLTIFGPGHAKAVRSSQALKLPVTIGDDLAWAQQAGHKPAATCHLEMPGLKRPEQVLVTFNGRRLPGGKLSHGWLDLDVPVACVKPGENSVEIALNPDVQVQPDQWTAVYEGSRRPQRPWTRDPGSPRTEEKLDGGSLFIADRGEQSGDYHYWRLPLGADPKTETVVEVRAKVRSGSNYVLLSNGDSHERLGLWPDRIDLWNNRNIQYKMDTTSDFHVYRVVMKDKDLRVYVDGQLRLNAAGKFKSADNAHNEMAFGAANSGQVGEAWWNYVKVRTNGQTCSDLVVRVTFAAP